MKKRTIVNTYKEALDETNKAMKQIKTPIDCETIHHYTNLNILTDCILKNLNIKLSRLDKVNDLTEGVLSNIVHLNNMTKFNTFVSCFQADINESIPMWGLYARDRKLKFEEGIKFGVKISFPYKVFLKHFSDSIVKDGNSKIINTKLTEEYLSKSIPSVFFKDIIKIKYDDELVNKDHFIYLERGEKGDEHSIIERINKGEKLHGLFNQRLSGLYKYNFWSYENEIRIRIITLDNVYDAVQKITGQIPYSFLFLHFKQELFSEMIITINPFINNGNYIKWKDQLLEKYSWLNENQIKKSILTDSIRL